MSAPPVPERPNLQALPAADAGTESRLDSGLVRGPAYVDLTDGRAQRRPIIPGHLRDGNGVAGLWRGVRRHLHHRAVEHGHRAAYHGVRSPRYALLTVGWAVVGLYRVSGRLLAWWHATDLYQLEHQAAADGLLTDHLRLHKQGRETRTARGLMLLLAAFAVLLAGLLAGKFAPRWLWLLAAVAAVLGLARAGRPAGKPIVQPAVLPAAVQPPTEDVITRALGSLGIAGIDRWLRDGRSLVFPAPVREDGPGWRAEVDLPFGVTATQVIERREQLASGLRRPLGAVWPEPVTSEHAGRLELWVGRQDVAKARQTAWPLARGQADVFGRLPFGTDVRGRTVSVPVMYHNWLIGALPGQGKTAAVRVLACAAALDPLCELWVHELKGSGDLDPLERVSHRFVSGINDEAIGYAAESLRLLRRELEARTERLKALPREICPDKRVTREIAARRSLKLWPVCCVIDELQNLFGHARFGKQAAEDAEYIIKTGRAFGVFLILATQRPDKASLPTGISANVSQRFCLKVMGQVENDMVLGTSAYRNGIRATTFRPELDAGIGYLVGAGPAPQVVRAFYLDLPATEKIAARARSLRGAAGTLSGAALGGTEDTPRDVLADLGAVFGSDAGLQWTEAAARLARRFPDRWDGTTAEAVSAECRALGIASVNVKAAGLVARGCRLADVTAAQDRQ